MPSTRSETPATQATGPDAAPPAPEPVADARTASEATSQEAGADHLESLIEALPPEIGQRMRELEGLGSVIEVVMDLGRQARSPLRWWRRGGPGRSRGRTG